MSDDSECVWAASWLSPEETSRRAREHTRETGHDTRVRHIKIVEYSAYGAMTPSSEPIAWRTVAKASMRSGRGSVLGPDTTRRTRWWEIDLEPCGHHVQRTVRYKPSDEPQHGGTQHRAADAVLPAPKRVRCEHCEQGEGERGTGRLGWRSGRPPAGDIEPADD
jgi:hypothetical protein